MTAGRWKQVKEVFHAALELPPDRRQAYLAEVSGGDRDLLEQVQSLLASHEEAEVETDYWGTGPAAMLESALNETAEQIGPYRLVSRIGSGGMAEVYKALDTRLGRNVALKLLLPEFAGDEEFKTRFLREARAVGALDHPAICRIYDIDEWHGRSYIAMEFLEGSTLRDRTQEAALSSDQVLAIGAAVAGALQAAHSRGFLHRDIKPGNIFLTTAGEVKVLDFGLAKRVRSIGSKEVTLTSPLSTPGTPAYMSPEQIKGEALDRRSDIFSFGVLLYEMAAGRKPFPGDNTALIFQKILHETPPAPSVLNPDMPAGLDPLILRCLEKDPANRYPDAGVILAELNRLRSLPLTRGSADPAGDLVAASIPRQGPPALAAISAAVAIVAASLLVAFFLFRKSGVVTPTEPPRIVAIESSKGSKDAPAFSPSGDRLAMALSESGDLTHSAAIYVKLMEADSSVKVSQAGDRGWGPVWSPDGLYLAYARASQPGAGYFIAPFLGGSEQKVAELYSPPFQAGGRNLDWSPRNDGIVIADRLEADGYPSIFRVVLPTRRKETLVRGARFYAHPVYSPDGLQLAFVSGGSLLSHDIYLMDLRTGRTRRVTDDRRWVAGIAWTRDGKEIVYSSNRSGVFALWRMPVAGGAAQLISIAGTDAFSPAIARQGSRLAFVRRTSNANLWKHDLATGVDSRLIVSTRMSIEPEISPDGERLVFSSNRNGGYEVWISDISGANQRKLTSMGGPLNGSPHWSRDGKWIAYDSRVEGHSDIFIIRPDGSSMRRLTSTTSDDYLPSWSADGHSLYFVSDRGGYPQLWRLNLEDEAVARVVEREAARGEETPDGKGIVFYAQHRLWMRDIKTQTDRLLIDDLENRGYFVAREGIYFAPEADWSKHTVELLDWDGRRHPVCGEIGPRSSRFGPIAVSPDRKYLLYERMDHLSSEVFLIENFR